MNYRANPLLYAAEPDFFSAFHIDIVLRESVDHATLARAVAQAMVRYPYFCVRPVRIGEELVLQSNPLPVPVFPDDRYVTLGTEQSNGHLLYFTAHGRTLSLNASHYLADGMGITPLWMTVLHLYVKERYDARDLSTRYIRLPEDPVPEAEYVYPLPDTPVVFDPWALPAAPPSQAYTLDPAAFDDGGLYAYHLHIPQRAMMAKANSSDGSPVSFLSVLIYRALCCLDPAPTLPVVGHVQHQYRAALRTPLCHHSMVSYVPLVLSPRLKTRDMMQQNTVARGQVILGIEPSADLAAIRRLQDAFPADASYDDKRQAMARYVAHSICGKTFGISYMGRIDWCGLDAYVEDIHAYIGEKHTRHMLLVEVMTIGEDFTITFMQSGRGDRYLQAFLEQLRACDIPVRLTGEQRYALCDTRLPE